MFKNRKWEILALFLAFIETQYAFKQKGDYSAKVYGALSSVRGVFVGEFQFETEKNYFRKIFLRKI